MRMMIRYQNGLRVEALLLAASKDTMRVAVESDRDTVELLKVEDCWYTEEGAEIEIEAMIPMSGADIAGFVEDVFPKTFTAGRSFLIA